MDYITIIPINSPVVVRSYTSGVFVGRIQAGEKGVVVLSDWRHLRAWKGVGNQGSVYDLIKSDVKPQQRSPLFSQHKILNQADVQVVDEAVYKRLADD